MGKEAHVYWKNEENPSNLERDRHKNFIFNPKCEKGKMHEDKVKFDQVNSAAIGGVAYFIRQRSVNEEEDIWWRKP